MSTTRPGGKDTAERTDDSGPTPRSDAAASLYAAGQFSPAMDSAVKNIQPGGGSVMSLELAWGKVRRWYLRRFRKSYVQPMETCRHGDGGSIPINPVDSRDIKFYRNQDTYWWAEQDDPYRWRDSLPFVRVGLAELIVMGGGFLLLAGLLAAIGNLWSWLAIPLLVLAGLVAWLFGDPPRSIPAELGTVVSRADRKLVQIEKMDDPDLGPCVQFGIFLSIFNLHANRASLPGKVVAIRYRPGKMLNALRPESAKENENLDVIIQSCEPDQKLYRIRQITGQFARRIVCWTRTGDILERGEMYGMIKLGSRTELLVPDSESLKIVAKVGDNVNAGSTIFAKLNIGTLNSA